MRKETRARNTRNKIMAVLAGGLVVGVGGALTLAVWTDTEWVFGANAAGDGPGVGTSTFEVQQNTANPFLPAGAFTDKETNPGGALMFGTSALALTPGDIVYAPVALKTTAASVAGTLQLKAAVAAASITVNDTGNLLRDALIVSVGTVTTAAATAPATCNAVGFPSYTSITMTGPGLFAVPATGTQAISAAGANVVHYCFKIELPANAAGTLQGRTVAPAWEFVATSN